MVTMITNLVAGGIKSFKSLSIIDIKLSILTRQERERLVLDLYYNQGKTIREIAKQARMSFRDIGVILNKTYKEKTEELKAYNNGADKNQEQEEQQLSVSTQAYNLFSEGKTPLEVSITLNLRESEATKFCWEYWKINQLHNLNMIYEEVKDDITYFLRLYKLGRAKGMDVEQIVNLLKIANNHLPAIEERFKRLRNDVSMLQSQKRIYERNLYQLNNQISTTTKLLNSFRISCERERRDIENLYNEKARLEAIVTEFKSNNEKYLKIKYVAKENVISILTNGKLLLQFATASVIESLKRNPELCNFASYSISNNNDTTYYGSNCHWLTLPRQQEQAFSYISSDDIYAALILEEAEKLYNELTTKLTNSVIAAATAIMASSLPSLNQKDNRL